MQTFLSALRGHHAFKALNYRDFRLITYSQIFANLGTWMDELSRGWLVYQLTDSAVQLGLVRGIQFIPLILLSPFAGSAVDRYSRKALLLIAQTANGCIFGIMAVLIFTGLVKPWHIYVAAVLAGIVQVVQQPARTSMVSDTVPLQYLTNAIGLTSLVFNMARLVGPALAGAIIVVANTGGAFGVQAACFFMAAIWTAQLDTKPRHIEGAGKSQRESFGRSIVVGWKFAWGNEAVRVGILCTTIVSVLMFPFTTLLPVFARDLLGVGASGQGLLLAAMGGGALISAAIITMAGHRLKRGRVVLASSLGYGLLLAVLAYSPWYGLSLALMVAIGLCHVHANALVNTIVQTYSPAEYRGRTMALYNMSQMISTAGSMLIGVLAAWLGPRGAVAAMSLAGALGIMLLSVLQPRAWHIK